MLTLTPLVGRRLFQSLKFNFRAQSRNFSNSNVISVEKKRLEAAENGNKEDVAPTFLPPADFQYNYEPMSIFEESIGNNL